MSIGIHLPGVLFMKVSVVIPAYNEEKFIKGCLQSLMEQEEKADEIIVVDNNSTDKTVKICKEFPVEIVYEPVQGITSARNAGFDKAAFDLIARCDADTIVPYDWIEKIKADFRKSNIDLLAGPVSFYDGPIKTSFPSRLFLFALKKLKKQHFTIGANMIITKAFWEKIKKVIFTSMLGFKLIWITSESCCVEILKHKKPAMFILVRYFFQSVICCMKMVPRTS